MRAMALILLPLLGTAALAQPRGGDAEEGRRLAEQWCANCHRITPGGPGPASDAVPSFAAIAAGPGRTAEGIATFLRNPHATMPDHGLTPAQARDLAAYVLAQRPR